MSNIAPLHPPQKSKLPTIKRDGGWCLMHLAQALNALEDLALPDECLRSDQLNNLKREDLASLFAVLGDYAEAARNAMPEDPPQVVQPA